MKSAEQKNCIKSVLIKYISGLDVQLVVMNSVSHTETNYFMIKRDILLQKDVQNAGVNLSNIKSVRMSLRNLNFKLCKYTNTSQLHCHYITKYVAVKVKMNVEDNLDSDIFCDFGN